MRWLIVGILLGAIPAIWIHNERAPDRSCSSWQMITASGRDAESRGASTPERALDRTIFGGETDKVIFDSDTDQDVNTVTYRRYDVEGNLLGYTLVEEHDGRWFRTGETDCAH